MQAVSAHPFASQARSRGGELNAQVSSLPGDKAMEAVVFDGSLRLVHDYPEPQVPRGWALLRVRLAGICRTDIEIVAGYMGFRGVLGHEFVADVVRSSDPSLSGRRVVGEINAACGSCPWCAAGLRRHCPNRTVLGIAGLDGCLAEYCALPEVNLHPVPDDLTDEQAVFVEPLAAACEILEQLAVGPEDRCVVLGDGKLGILCAWVLSDVCDVNLVGHHAEKLNRAAWPGVRTTLRTDGLERADIVVEATGTATGLAAAMDLCRPRGTIVLKSTVADNAGVNMAPLVVNEITVIGSRCGPFSRALEMMRRRRFPLERLITARYPLSDSEQAFAAARNRGALKVLVQPWARPWGTLLASLDTEM